MKTIKIIFSCILILFICISCKNSNSVILSEMKESFAGNNFKIMVVDSCEYVCNGNWFSHKGNCKYCIERNNKINE